MKFPRGVSFPGRPIETGITNSGREPSMTYTICLASETFTFTAEGLFGREAGRSYARYVARVASTELDSLPDGLREQEESRARPSAMGARNFIGEQVKSLLGF